MSAEKLHTLLSTVPKLKSHPRSDYERDDRECQVLLSTFDAEERQNKPGRRQ